MYNTTFDMIFVKIDLTSAFSSFAHISFNGVYLPFKTKKIYEE